MSTAADIRVRPEDKEGHSFRFRNDTWADVKEAVKSSTASDYTEWVKEAVEARLGYVRCDRGRCGEPVPVEWGDLTGHPFDWWIGEAIAEVRGQKCRAHHPVTIGNATAPAPTPKGAPGKFMEPKRAEVPARADPQEEPQEEPPRCGQPTGGSGHPADTCGRPEGHTGKHRGEAATRRRNQTKAAMRAAQWSSASPLPRCGHPMRGFRGAPPGMCGLTEGHSGDHRRGGAE